MTLNENRIGDVHRGLQGNSMLNVAQLVQQQVRRNAFTWTWAPKVTLLGSLIRVSSSHVDELTGVERRVVLFLFLEATFGERTVLA